LRPQQQQRSLVDQEPALEASSVFTGHGPLSPAKVLFDGALNDGKVVARHCGTRTPNTRALRTPSKHKDKDFFVPFLKEGTSECVARYGIGVCSVEIKYLVITKAW
jgi:hypothetical protein